ncbi:hypothetical protein DFJ77DRAFT_450430 [Powellomyces hirtus]|nr:hypothetical protein DFJ77DRAFT_450430 [Powellomyces hirtus]
MYNNPQYDLKGPSLRVPAGLSPQAAAAAATGAPQEMNEAQTHAATPHRGGEVDGMQHHPLSHVTDIYEQTPGQQQHTPPVLRLPPPPTVTINQAFPFPKVLTPSPFPPPFDHDPDLTSSSPPASTLLPDDIAALPPLPSPTFSELFYLEEDLPRTPRPLAPPSLGPPQLVLTPAEGNARVFWESDEPQQLQSHASQRHSRATTSSSGGSGSKALGAGKTRVKSSMRKATDTASKEYPPMPNPVDSVSHSAVLCMPVGDDSGGGGDASTTTMLVRHQPSTHSVIEVLPEKSPQGSSSIESQHPVAGLRGWWEKGRKPLLVVVLMVVAVALVLGLGLGLGKVRDAPPPPPSGVAGGV